MRDAISGDRDPTLPQRVAAASATGFGGSICANALDIVKVRQFDQPHRYPSLPAALRQIATEEGWAGLLVRGVSASAPRGAAIAVGEVTTLGFGYAPAGGREGEVYRPSYAARALVWVRWTRGAPWFGRCSRGAAQLEARPVSVWTRLDPALQLRLRTRRGRGIKRGTLHLTGSFTVCFGLNCPGGING